MNPEPIPQVNIFYKLDNFSYRLRLTYCFTISLFTELVRASHIKNELFYHYLRLPNESLGFRTNCGDFEIGRTFPTADIKQAEILIINSCSVRQSAINRIYGQLIILEKTLNKIVILSPECSGWRIPLLLARTFLFTGFFGRFTPQMTQKNYLNRLPFRIR